jgi:hypothetical protein
VTHQYHNPDEPTSPQALELERQQLAALSGQLQGMIDVLSEQVSRIQAAADRLGDAKERRSEAARKANATRKDRKAKGAAGELPGDQAAAGELGDQAAAGELGDQAAELGSTTTEAEMPRARTWGSQRSE